MQDVLDTVISLSKVDIKQELDPSRLRNVDETILKANVTKLMNTVGEVPTLNVLNTCRDILDFWRGKIKRDYGIV